MAGLIKPLNNVYDQFRRLPGVGSKSALRLAYHIIDMPEEDVRRLAETLIQAKRDVHFCRVCHNLTDGNICSVCSDAQRDKGIVCVVEQPQDAMAMERSRGYSGVYHILHGCLSPLDGIGPEDLTIKELMQRVDTGEIKEIILATNSNVEGEATAAYLTQLLRSKEVVISRIAHGLPIGSDLEYVDELTLAKALENRTRLDL